MSRRAVITILMLLFSMGFRSGEGKSPKCVTEWGGHKLDSRGTGSYIDTVQEDNTNSCREACKNHAKCMMWSFRREDCHMYDASVGRGILISSDSLSTIGYKNECIVCSASHLEKLPNVEGVSHCDNTNVRQSCTINCDPGYEP
eukprot:39202_1